MSRGGLAIIALLAWPPLAAAQQPERVPTDPTWVTFTSADYGTPVVKGYAVEWGILGGAFTWRALLERISAVGADVRADLPDAVRQSPGAVDLQLRVVAIGSQVEGVSQPVVFCEQANAPKGQTCAKPQALSTRKSRLLRWLGL